MPLLTPLLGRAPPTPLAKQCKPLDTRCGLRPTWRMSIAHDEELEALVEQAQSVIRGVAPQSLRDNDALRQQIATQMSAVQASLDGMMVDRPRRNILRKVR